MYSVCYLYVSNLHFTVYTEDVDFRPGDEVMISGSGFERNHEKNVVKELIGSRQVIFEQPLNNTYQSYLYPIEREGNWSTVTADIRGEIGLLTRNIKISGDDINTRDLKFGVHVMAMHGAEMRLENLEITECGQV